MGAFELEKCLCHSPIDQNVRLKSNSSTSISKFASILQNEEEILFQVTLNLLQNSSKSYNSDRKKPFSLMYFTNSFIQNFSCCQKLGDGMEGNENCIQASMIFVDPFKF